MPTEISHDECGDDSEVSRNCSFTVSPASVVLGTSCVIVCIVVIAVATTTSNFHDNHPIVWSIVAITSILSTILTIVIWKRIHTLGQNSLDYRILDVAIKPKILFLWIFGFAKIFSSTLEIAVGFHCVNHSEKQMFPGEIFLSIFTNFSEIAFVISQLCFLSSYSTCKLKADNFVNIGLWTILLTLIVQWFKTLFTTLARNNMINDITMNDTRNSCFQTDGFKVIEKSILPYTEPMSTEYGLLAVGIILRLAPFFDCSGTTLQFEYQDVEQTPLLRVHNFGTAASYRTPIYNGHHDSTEVMNRNQFQIPSFYCCLLTAFISCLPILVTIILNAYEGTEVQFALGVVQFVFKVELTTLTILSCYLWYKQYGKHNICIQKYDGKLTLLLSTAGTLIHFTFGLIAGVIHEKQEKSSDATFLILQKVLEIVIVVIQTFLILRAQRLRTVHVNRQPRCLSVGKLFYVFYLMRVIMWIADSYIGKNTGKIMPIESEVYGDKFWKTVNDMLYPFTMFYLFHTAIDFYQMHIKYEKSI